MISRRLCRLPRFRRVADQITRKLHGDKERGCLDQSLGVLDVADPGIKKIEPELLDIRFIQTREANAIIGSASEGRCDSLGHVRLTVVDALEYRAQLFTLNHRDIRFGRQ